MKLRASSLRGLLTPVLLVLPLLLLLPLLVAACGGGGGETATTAAASPATAPGTAGTAAVTSTTVSGETTLPPGSTTTGSQAPGANTVSIVEYAFEPSTIVISQGQTVHWVNDGRLTHTVTADDGTFDSGDLSPGQTFDFTFAKAGSYPYKCTIHPDRMTGVVEVQP